MLRSAFWGQSFVAELTRLSELGKKQRSLGGGGDVDEAVDLKADEAKTESPGVPIKVQSPEGSERESVTPPTKSWTT